MAGKNTSCRVNTFSVSNERSARGSHLFRSQTMMTRLYHQTTMTSLCHGTLIHRYTHYICSGHWLSRPLALEDKVHCSKYLLRSFQKCTRRLFTERPMHVGASIITLVNLENDDFALRILNAWFQWKEMIIWPTFIAPFLGFYQLCNERLLTGKITINVRCGGIFLPQVEGAKCLSPRNESAASVCGLFLLLSIFCIFCNLRQLQYKRRGHTILYNVRSVTT